MNSKSLLGQITVGVIIVLLSGGADNRAIRKGQSE